MKLRSRSEINADIIKHEDALKSLRDEIKLIEQHCPHPDVFLQSYTRDFYDTAGAPVYEMTYVTVTCSLCGKSNTVEFDKDMSSEPTIRSIISK